MAGTETAGDLTESLYAGLIFGDATTGSLIDSVRQNLPDAEELELGGMVAIPGPTSPGTGEAEGWSMSNLNVFPDPMVMLVLQATAPDEVDGQAALASLVELAASRIASVEPPFAVAIAGRLPGAVERPSTVDRGADGSRGPVPERHRWQPGLGRPESDRSGVPLTDHQLQADGTEGDQGAQEA